MTDFASIILEESKTISELNADIHRTFLNRDKDRETWSRACAKFHEYVPKFNCYLENIYGKDKLDDQEAIEFSLVFLEKDPKFFRSGYIKEEILTRIKRSELSDKQHRRLLAILLDAINRRGSKEFKYYCRVAGFIADLEFIQTLNHIAATSSGDRKGRAKRMLMTIEHSKTHNKFKNENASKAGTDAQKVARPF